MKIGIDMGHTLYGADIGARGCGYKEEYKTREIGRNLINLFLQDNNEVDLFISLHLNAYNGEARGVETHVYEECNQKSIDYAQMVQRELCKLGYVNRGVKKGNLYVLKNTKSQAMLIECGFIDNSGDMAIYNPDNIAKAIYLGIIVDGEDNTISSKAATMRNDWISKLQNECNIQGFSKQTVDGLIGLNTINGCPLMREGAKGNITGLLQEKLISLGYDCGIYGADGIWGIETTKSVIQFQKSSGLIADGVVGKNTWSRLINS